MSFTPLAPEEWVASLEGLGDTPGKQRVTEKLTPAAGPVCVTGASGFIALHLVQQLLEKGYTVVGTVRSLSNEAKLKPLRDLQQKFGEDKLRLADGVDCNIAETFDAAVAGCVGVFHTASPFHFNSQDPMKDLIPPAFQGTVGCLAACQKASCVKRVIVTSSFACVMNFGKYPWDYGYSSKDWNMVSYPDKDGAIPAPVPQNGYRFSKLVAEKAAWDFAAKEDCPFDVACINPPMVIGHNYNKPSSLEDLNTSSATLLKILTGKQAPNPNAMGWVDVADVAKAHIAAYEHPEAGGRRFLCAANEVPLWTQVAAWLKEMYPEYPVIIAAPEGGEGIQMTMDTSGLKSLSGFDFTPLRDTLKVQGDSLIKEGWAKPY